MHFQAGSAIYSRGPLQNYVQNVGSITRERLEQSRTTQKVEENSKDIIATFSLSPVTVDESQVKVAKSVWGNDFWVQYTLPFEGDWRLLFFVPSATNNTPPTAFLFQDSIVLKYKNPDDPDRLKARFASELRNLQEWIRYSNGEVEGVNAQIQAQMERLVQERQDLLKKQGWDLGYPSQ